MPSYIPAANKQNNAAIINPAQPNKPVSEADALENMMQI
jgi:hypothetical protein